MPSRKNNKCRICGADTGKPTRGYCSEKCRKKGWNMHIKAGVREKEMSAAEVYVTIERSVRDEHLPPWVRHPIPWDHVVMVRK